MAPGSVDLDQRSQAPQRIGFRLDRDHMPQPIEPTRLRQDHREHAVFRHHLQRRDGVGSLQQFYQLLSHPLGGEIGQQMGHGTAGGTRRRIAEAGAEARLEPVVTQDPQHILGDAGRGVADKSHPARPQIGEASDRIVHRAVGIEKDRVDREVAPRRIGRPVGVEGDAGAAAVSLDVAPQGGDLEMARRGAGNRGHGAVGEDRSARP